MDMMVERKSLLRRCRTGPVVEEKEVEVGLDWEAVKVSFARFSMPAWILLVAPGDRAISVQMVASGEASRSRRD